MTTSMTQYIKSLPDLNPDEIPQGVKGYCRSKVRNDVHQLVLSEYLRLSEDEGFTKADIAKRLGKDPAQINRLLGSPGNWTIDTFADLMMAMGMFPVMHSEVYGTKVEPNFCHPEYERNISVKYAPETHETTTIIYFSNDTSSDHEVKLLAR